MNKLTLISLIFSLVLINTYIASATTQTIIETFDTTTAPLVSTTLICTQYNYTTSNGLFRARAWKCPDNGLHTASFKVSTDTPNATGYSLEWLGDRPTAGNGDWSSGWEFMPEVTKSYNQMSSLTITSTSEMYADCKVWRDTPVRLYAYITFTDSTTAGRYIFNECNSNADNGLTWHKGVMVLNQTELSTHIGKTVSYIGFRVEGTISDSDYYTVRVDNVVMKDFNTCFPNWVCSAYAYNEFGENDCISYTDTNSCGLPYTGYNSSVILYMDDFNDGIIDYNFWDSTGGTACTETTGKLTCNGNNVWIRSKALDTIGINTSKPFRITYNITHSQTANNGAWDAFMLQNNQPVLADCSAATAAGGGAYDCNVINENCGINPYCQLPAADRFGWFGHEIWCMDSDNCFGLGRAPYYLVPRSPFPFTNQINAYYYYGPLKTYPRVDSMLYNSRGYFYNYNVNQTTNLPEFQFNWSGTPLSNKLNYLGLGDWNSNGGINHIGGLVTIDNLLIQRVKTQPTILGADFTVDNQTIYRERIANNSNQFTSPSSVVITWNSTTTAYLDAGETFNVTNRWSLAWNDGVSWSNLITSQDINSYLLTYNDLYTLDAEKIIPLRLTKTTNVLRVNSTRGLDSSLDYTNSYNNKTETSYDYIGLNYTTTKLYKLWMITNNSDPFIDGNNLRPSTPGVVTTNTYMGQSHKYYVTDYLTASKSTLYGYRASGAPYTLSDGSGFYYNFGTFSFTFTYTSNVANTKVKSRGTGYMGDNTLTGTPCHTPSMISTSVSSYSIDGQIVRDNVCVYQPNGIIIIFGAAKNVNTGGGGGTRWIEEYNQSVYYTCVPDYVYGAWSEGDCGTRTVVDNNVCGDERISAITSLQCPLFCGDGICNNGETQETCPTDCHFIHNPGPGPIQIEPAPGLKENQTTPLICSPNYEYIYKEEFLTNYEDIPISNYIREKSTAETCGIDADQDGLKCDLNEDFISCSRDCKLNLAEFLCLGDKCIYTEPWFLKVSLIMLTMTSLYLLYIIYLV